MTLLNHELGPVEVVFCDIIFEICPFYLIRRPLKMLQRLSFLAKHTGNQVRQLAPWPNRTIQDSVKLFCTRGIETEATHPAQPVLLFVNTVWSKT